MEQTQHDEKDVALANLANLIRLISAELVIGRHRDDLGLLERAIRNKLDAFAFDGVEADTAKAGHFLATDYVERALMQVRAKFSAEKFRSEDDLDQCKIERKSAFH